MLYVPEGFAHGFQTLQDNTEVFYQMTDFIFQNALRWDDLLLAIQWPGKRLIIPERDKGFKNYKWKNQ